MVEMPPSLKPVHNTYIAKIVVDFSFSYTHIYPSIILLLLLLPLFLLCVLIIAILPIFLYNILFFFPTFFDFDLVFLFARPKNEDEVPFFPFSFLTWLCAQSINVFGVLYFWPHSSSSLCECRIVFFLFTFVPCTTGNHKKNLLCQSTHQHIHTTKMALTASHGRAQTHRIKRPKQIIV